MRRILDFATLVGSTGTLVCCVLPAIFVTMGFGATFASLVGAFPAMTWLSEHKPFVFGGAAVLIALSVWSQWRARYAACPIDPQLAKACTQTRAWSRRLLVLSLIFFVVGTFTTFLAPLLSRG